MIGRGLLLLAIPIVASACSMPTASDGPITISLLGWGGATTIRVEPDGRMRADGPAIAGTDERGDYRRFVELLEPARTYAGGTVPCAKPLASELGSEMGNPVPVTIRWQATNEVVRVDLTCMTQAEPYLGVKNALDLAKRWGRTPESVGIPPPDVEKPIDNAD